MAQTFLREVRFKFWFYGEYESRARKLHFQSNVVKERNEIRKELYKMKSRKEIFKALILTVVLAFGCSSAYAVTLLFEDGFENIAVGDYPGENGWEELTANDMDAFVSDRRSFSGTKSLEFWPTTNEAPQTSARVDYIRISEPAQEGTPINWSCALWLDSVTNGAMIVVGDFEEPIVSETGFRVRYA